MLIQYGFDATVLTSSKGPSKPRIIETVPCEFSRNLWQMLALNPLCFIYHRLPNSVKDTDIVHVHSYIYFLANQVALYHMSSKFPFVLHLHGGTSPITTDVYGLKPAMAKILYDRTIGKWTINSATKIMCSSKDDMRNAVERFGAEQERLIHVPNSIFVDDFYSQNGNTRIVTFLARLTQLKGCYYMPEIIKRVHNEHKDVHFWIVGEGYMEGFLRKELEGLPVKFYGAIPHSQVPSVFAKSYISYLPTHTESCPLSLLESMASSVPVVASAVGGVPEIVRNNKTGFLSPVGNPEYMANKIIYLLDNEDERRRMGREAKKMVEEEYSWKVNVKKVIDTYASLM